MSGGKRLHGRSDKKRLSVYYIGVCRVTDLDVSSFMAKSEGCCNHIGLSAFLKPLEVKDNKKTQWSLQSENGIDRNRL